MSGGRAETLLAQVGQAFAGVPRPLSFVDASHCCECAEHEATLAAHTPDSIGLAALGNPGWDPICFVGVEGYLYFFPALARLALGRSPETYVDQFLFHLMPERSERFDRAQRAAVLALLHALPEILGDDLLLESDGVEVERRIAELERQAAR